LYLFVKYDVGSFIYICKTQYIYLLLLCVFAQTDLCICTSLCLFASQVFLCEADCDCLQNAGFVYFIMAQYLLHSLETTLMYHMQNEACFCLAIQKRCHLDGSFCLCTIQIRLDTNTMRDVFFCTCC